METILTYFRYFGEGDLESEDQARLDYLAYCVENDAPYLGFFYSVFSPGDPFSLKAV